MPIDKTAYFIGFINQLEKESGMQMVSFGHAGDGNVHLCVVRGNRDDETWEKELVVMNSIKNALDPLHILNDKKSYITGEQNEEFI